MKKIFLLVFVASGLFSAGEVELNANKVFLNICGNPALPKSGSDVVEVVNHFHQLALDQGIAEIRIFFSNKNNKVNNRSEEECIIYLRKALIRRCEEILEAEVKKDKHHEGLICFGFFVLKEHAIGIVLYDGNRENRILREA